MTAAVERRADEGRRLALLPCVVVGSGQIERDVDDVKQLGAALVQQLAHAQIVARREAVEFIAVLGVRVGGARKARTSRLRYMSFKEK